MPLPFVKTVLENLTSRPATRMYPVAKREPFEKSRGELYNEIEKCIFCKSCQRACPSQCITVDVKEATWSCDPYECVYCGFCVDVCPVNCLHHKSTYRAAGYDRPKIQLKGEIKRKPKAKAEVAETAAADDGDAPASISKPAKGK